MDDLFVYMDDILVSSKDMDWHLKTVRELFRRLDKYGMAISLKKCAFSRDTVDLKKWKPSTGFHSPKSRNTYSAF